jgi:hypothetical protein
MASFPILRRRPDLSDWLIHFIRQPTEIGSSEFREQNRVPLQFDEEGEPIFSAYDWLENDWLDRHGLSTAFGVLLKIVFDGFLKPSWSFRGDRATVYGPRSAVCFTEMPLYALVQYARSRRDKEAVDCYGIALRRDELFREGARPVLYGLSGEHRLASEGDPFYDKGLRCLSESTGIGLLEQYRYVATALGEKSSIDWTHEREWRWPYRELHETCQGLPLWGPAERRLFSRVICIVPTRAEARELLRSLKEMHDAGGNDFGIQFSRALLMSTRVIALDALAATVGDDVLMRLDDAPSEMLTPFKSAEPSDATVERVRQLLEEVRKVGARAYERALSLFPGAASGQAVGSFGFVSVRTFDGESEATAALLKLKAARAIGGCGYIMESDAIGASHTGSVEVDEISANATAEALTHLLGQPFTVEIRLD